MGADSSKFKNTYRITSNRMKDWDYGSPGYYFVTLCTRKKACWFGEVRNEKVRLSPAGEVARQFIEKIPQIHPNYSLPAWVVMLNHIHAIIGIEDRLVPSVETPHRGVSTTKPWRPGVLGAVINQYKSACTKRIRALGYVNFRWQAGYYDHIIRNEKYLQDIYRYMLGNPAKWAEDEYSSGWEDRGNTCSENLGSN